MGAEQNKWHERMTELMKGSNGETNHSQVMGQAVGKGTSEEEGISLDNSSLS